MMIRRLLGLCLATLALSGCAATDLSRAVTRLPSLPAEGIRIGFVADSQLQTRGNNRRVWGYRDRVAEVFVGTAIRPPALDWAARSMLRSQLQRLWIEGAQAIFYLGDGANNGCYDELALGFGDGARPGANEMGVLALLDAFRAEARIPVFFILGNHDVLGAGSTSRADLRDDFCRANEGPANRYVDKLEAMRLAEAFNLGNAAIAPAWRYRSSWDATATAHACAGDQQRQHRRAGCYLAATVDFARDGATAQFLLLDTNDWADVSNSSFARLMQEGIRGAMSFDDTAAPQTLSQTSWFDRHAATPVDLRVALSHYDVAGLRKALPIIGAVSAKSQMYMNLFTSEEQTRLPLQAQAYVVTGHTHTREIDPKLFVFKTDCGRFRCAQTDRFRIRELNVGSTTDYSNYATIAQFGVGARAAEGMAYHRVESEERCTDVWTDVAHRRFSRPVHGQNSGWPGIGVQPGSRTNYHAFSFADLRNLWANLDNYAGGDAHRADCIGLFAAAVEAKVDPLHRLPPQPK